MSLNRRLLRNLDLALVGSVVLLTMVGFLVVLSATQGLARPGGDPYYFLKKQAAWAVVGATAAAFVLSVDYRTLGRFVRPIYASVIVLLIAVLVLAPRIMGVESWLVLGPLRLQPSEIAKIGIILTLSKHLDGKEGLGRVRDLVSPLLHIALPLGLILLQPDLGTALVFVGILFGMLFVAGARPAHLLSMAGLGVAGMIGSVFLSRLGVLPLLKEYQIKRLLVFLNPYAYEMDAGWNVIQSMIAIGSGRFFGKGLFGGSQTQLDFLPARHTDFIFSVIGEELGFLGAFTVLALFFILLWRTVNTITWAKDRQGALIVTGVLSMLLCHLVINVGMAIGLMPITGIPLPFISYGGSSFLTNAIGVALVMNVYMRRQKILF